MKLYVKMWCPWCVDAIAWMNKRALAFETIDVIADPVAFRKMREISGQTYTPTIELANGEFLADFDTGQLERFLKARGLLREPR